MSSFFIETNKVFSVPASCILDDLDLFVCCAAEAYSLALMMTDGRNARAGAC